MGQPASNERGTGGPMTENRWTGPPASVQGQMASLDRVLDAIKPDYHGNVPMLIASAESTHNHSFMVNAAVQPLRRKTAAKQLLAIHEELLSLAAVASRDRNGVLLTRDLFGELVPW